jgi:hypothetical protein
MSMVAVTVVAGGYRAVPESPTAMTWRSKSATALRLRTCGRLYVDETLLEGLAPDLQGVAAALRPCIQPAHPMVGQGHLAGHRHLAAADQAGVRDGVMGARHGRVVTHARRSPVRPATWCMRVVSRASARVIAGRIVVSRHASIDLPAPGGPMRRTLWSERRHDLQLYPHLQGC